MRAFRCTAFQREVVGRSGSPYTGKLSARPTGKPGDSLIVKGELATFPSRHFDPCSSINTEAPQYAFFEAWRNLSGPMGFIAKNQILGQDRAASRRSAPSPGKRTRREDRAPSHRPQMSSGRLFLDRVGRHQSPSPLRRHAQTTTHFPRGISKPELSTLLGTGTFYFALTHSALTGGSIRASMLQFSTHCVNWTALTSEELIRACVKASDTAAWEEFVRRFRPVIAGTVMRTARRCGETAPEIIDDLVQETYLKICSNRCRILREFEPQAVDAIFGLLKTVAFSVTQDYFRVGLAAKRGAGRQETALDNYVESAVAGREGLPEVEREILIRQIDEHLTAAAEPATRNRDRQIFWLYYRHGMTSRAIAGIPGLGLTQKGVESAIQRLTNHVRLRLANCKMEGTEGKSSASSF
jgi:RNA polymerase sigma-70 factor (ECF subfamily)